MGRVPVLLRGLTVAFAATTAGVFLVGGRAMAGGVAVADGSHVLSRSDVSMITDAGSRLGKDAVRVYTTTVLAGDDDAFDNHYAEKLATLSPATIVVGVNTRSGHVTIHGGTGSHLHRPQSSAAVAAFTEGLRADHRYGDALAAMMQSLQKSLTGRQSTTYSAKSTAADKNRATAGGRAGAPGGTPQAATTHATSGMSTTKIAVIAIGALVVLTLVAGICRAIVGGGRRRRDQWI